LRTKPIAHGAFSSVLPEEKFVWRPHPKSFSLGNSPRTSLRKPVAKFVGVDVHQIKMQTSVELNRRKELLESFDSDLASARMILSKIDDATLLSTLPYCLHRAI
jgi:hypothetical protein